MKKERRNKRNGGSKEGRKMTYERERDYEWMQEASPTVNSHTHVHTHTYMHTHKQTKRKKERKQKELCFQFHM